MFLWHGAVLFPKASDGCTAESVFMLGPSTPSCCGGGGYAARLGSMYSGGQTLGTGGVRIFNAVPCRSGIVHHTSNACFAHRVFAGCPCIYTQQGPISCSFYLVRVLSPHRLVVMVQAELEPEAGLPLHAQAVSINCV